MPFFFVFKNTHFAQVLEIFAQTCIYTSATFRSSGSFLKCTVDKCMDQEELKHITVYQKAFHPSDNKKLQLFAFTSFLCFLVNLVKIIVPSGFALGNSIRRRGIFDRISLLSSLYGYIISHYTTLYHGLATFRER